MKGLYLDNSATSYPKAPGVSNAVRDYIDNVGNNVNRSGYSGIFAGEEMVFTTRELLCDLFNFQRPENVVFTMNITQGLNFLLKGILKSGDHCLVSSMEHNAVMRPLAQLALKGVEYSRVMASKSGQLNPRDLLPHIKDNTKALFINHASNVCGTILPISGIGEICRNKNIFFIVDTAQTAGALPIDWLTSKADALAFTGHKSLLGPQGTGGFIISERLAESIEPLISGGTGSLSEHEIQPEYMPDKFEAGTMNLPGLAGLHAALKYITSIGIDAIREKEQELTARLLEGFAEIKTIRIIGLLETEGRMPAVSIDCPNYDNADVAHSLDKYYGIRTRCGLHCAPSAHKTLGTFPHGTIRFSPGFFNTKEEMDYAVSSLKKILKNS